MSREKIEGLQESYLTWCYYKTFWFYFGSHLIVFGTHCWIYALRSLQVILFGDCLLKICFLLSFKKTIFQCAKCNDMGKLCGMPGLKHGYHMKGKYPTIVLSLCPWIFYFEIIVGLWWKVIGMLYLACLIYFDSSLPLDILFWQEHIWFKC